MAKKGCFMYKRGGGLFPHPTMGDKTALDKYKDDDIIAVTFVKPRNVLLLRKYWALIGVVFPHQDIYPTTDALEEWILIAIGHCEEVPCIIVVDGKKEKAMRLKAKSIAFANLDEDSFQEIYERMERVILQRILPNVDLEELRLQVFDIMKGR